MTKAEEKPEFDFDEAFSGYELEQIEIYAKIKRIFPHYSEARLPENAEQLYDLYLKSKT